MRDLIRSIIQEAFGDGGRYGSGANYFTSHQLILQAYSDKAVEAHLKAHPGDLKAVFDHSWDKYHNEMKRNGLPGAREDRETIMYDFMAHFRPEDETSQEAQPVQAAKPKPSRRFQSGAKTKSANEMLKFARKLPFTCARIIADNNGQMRPLFDFILNRFQEDIIGKLQEDPEKVFYDFAANYPKEKDYWEQMGRKIIGPEIWEDHLNGKSNYFQRYCYIHVRDGYVEEVERRLKAFGWWHYTFDHTPSLASTGMMIAPLPVKMKA